MTDDTITLEAHAPEPAEYERARARVLLITDRPDAAEALRVVLLHEGFAVRMAPTDADPRDYCDGPADILVIDAGAGARPRLGAAMRWRRALQPDAPCVTLLEDPACSDAVREAGRIGDVVSTPLGAPGGVAARIRAALRLRNVSEEARLRAQSLSRYGGADRARVLAGAADDRDPIVLALGAPSPQFLPARAALCGAGLDVVAALSPGGAFDYMERTQFDAALAFLDEDASQTLNVCAVMRRNPRLYDTPVLAVMGHRCTEDLNRIFSRGVSDVIHAGGDADGFTGQVMSHVRRFRRTNALREYLKQTQPAEIVDPTTGLFSSVFFGSHFSRLAARAKATRRPLTLAAFRLREFERITAEEGAEAAGMLLRQAADTARLLVRAEDFAARLGADTFLIALPSTLPEDGAVAVRRICGMLAHTRFKRTLEDRGVTIALDHGIVEHRPDETIERTVAGALAELAARSL